MTGGTADGAAPYTTIEREVEVEEVVKGSRFVAWVAPAALPEEALERVRARSALHAEATHNAWAYRFAVDYRFSDDGEPGGTAGRPMLEVLTRRELERVVGVVTRYYGGTKLGAGGLVRAYGGTFAKALDAAGVLLVKPRVRLELEAGFGDVDVVHRLLDAWPSVVRDEPAYTERGLLLRLSVLEEERAGFERAVRDATRGAAEVREATGRA